MGFALAFAPRARPPRPNTLNPEHQSPKPRTVNLLLLNAWHGAERADARGPCMPDAAIGVWQMIRIVASAYILVVYLSGD